MSSVKKYGQWALITGASEGIGKGFARHCAQQGFDLVMIARRESLLNETAQEIRNEFDVKVKTLSLDLTDEDCTETLIDFCSDIEIGMLINNAAFSYPAEFLTMRIGDISKQIHINIHVITVLTHYFGNVMKQRGRGAIINVSSKTGEVPMPYFAMYSACKSFISTLTEAIWFEVKDNGVDVLALKPCQTATEGYLRRNPEVWGDDGIQTVEDCVSEAFAALGQHAGWLPWPPSRDDVKVLRDMPLEQAITRNGDGMKQVFAKQLAE